MTRMRSITPPDPAPPSGAPSAPVNSFARVPPYAPHVVLLNKIGISVPDDILVGFREERVRRHHLLVRRFINQLLYGCQNPACNTPTCFSYQKRVAKTPRRRFTPLSARTIAAVLASEKELEGALCHNKPAIPLEIAAHNGRQPSHKSRSGSNVVERQVSRAVQDIEASRKTGLVISVPQSEQTLLNNVGAQIAPPLPQANNGANVPKIEKEEQLDLGVMTDAPKARHAHLKDHKSFTQNLFDTIALRMLEWVPLGNPLRSRAVQEARGIDDEPLSTKVSDTTDGPPSTNTEGAAQREEGGETNEVGMSNSDTELANGFVEQPDHGATSSNKNENKISNHGTQLKEKSTTTFPEENDESEEEPRAVLAVTTTQPLDQPKGPSSQATPSTPSAHGALQPPSRKHRLRSQEMREVKASRTRRSPTFDTTSHTSLPIRSESEDSMRGVYADIIDSLAPSVSDGLSNHNLLFTVPYAEALPYLSAELLTALRQMMFHGDGDEVVGKWLGGSVDATCRLGFRPQDSSMRYVNKRQEEEIVPFVRQSLFYVFKDPSRILNSFRDGCGGRRHHADAEPSLRLDPTMMTYSFQTVHLLLPYSETLSFLWHALTPLFDPPPWLPQSAHSRTKAGNGSGSRAVSASVSSEASKSPKPFINDVDAAYVCTVALYALATLVPSTTCCEHNTESWNAFRKVRATGRIFPHTEMEKLEHSCQSTWLLELTDRFENEFALRLVEHMVGAINNRLVYQEICRTKQKNRNAAAKKGKPLNVVQLILRHLQKNHVMHGSPERSSIRPEGLLAWAYHEYPSEQNLMATATLEWFRTLLLKEWDGKPQTRRAGTVGSVVQFLAAMYKERINLGLLPEDFHTSFLSERLDSMDMPVEWLASRPGDNKTIHLLTYSFLFPPAAVVTYFRAMNFATMSKAYETALTTDRHAQQMIFSDFITVPNHLALLQKLKPATDTFLVLTIRRDNVLADAMNQVWRREKRELLRPLKVRMGFEEGEEGIDHGGVQQEFFRVLLAEALDPVYGMFITDPMTRMLWFRPGSLEPLFKFEMLGLLMSIAIYNAVTLPVTFPLVFYRKLLGLKVKTIDHIADGWPDLFRGFGTLLNWSKGDVADVFTRTYEFSYEAYGNIVDVDMEKVDRDAQWPPLKRDKGKEKAKTATFEFPGLTDSDDEHALADQEEHSKNVQRKSHSSRKDPSPITTPKSSIRTTSVPASYDSEASLVTNENRAQFVKDYIFWLTDKSIRPQYEAFARGFFTCLDRNALSIFMPEALKTVVEGLEDIDIDELARTAKYDDGYTAQHRVIQDFWFVVKEFTPEKKRKLLEFVTASDRVPVNGISSIQFIVQRNGTDDKRLPTSLTCFGRLLLPEYSSREALADKLNKAIENATGFGVA